MTIMNEAVRLFFAVSALVLVGLLSTPLESTQVPTNSEQLPVMTSNKTLEGRSSNKSKMQIADRKIDKKLNRKALAKKS